MINSKEFRVENGILKKYSGKGEEAVIPYGVREIGSSVFLGCKDLKSVVIPETVNRIGSFAFKECAGLRQIVIPNSVESVMPWCFSSCESLERVVIAPLVKDIFFGAFALCDNLKSVEIGGAQLRIQRNAFVNAKSVTLPVGIDGKWNLMLDEGFKQLKYIFVSLDGYRVLEDRYRRLAIGGFLRRWKNGELTEEETKYISSEIDTFCTELLGTYGEDRTLYEFTVKYKCIDEKTARGILDVTGDLECRAILLKYLNEISHDNSCGSEG